jgi:transmembrane sensor
MNRQIIQEAADWFVELNTGPLPDLEVRMQFDRWLRTSPEHVRTFLELIPIWEHGSQLPQDPDATSQQLIAWARGGTNIISMPGERRPRGSSEGRRTQAPSSNSSIRRSWAIGWAVTILVAIGALMSYGYLRHPTYVTGIGEQRSLILADNSVLNLNARSKVRIRYSGHERAIDLLEGQALFRVAKSPGRPFVVYSGETRTRALGTEFDIYRKPNGTVITVVAGRVAVDSQELNESSSNVRGASGRSAPKDTMATLAAGEQLTVGPQGIHKAEHPNLAGATAWTQRQLVFDSTPLPEVAQEFNRYNTRVLTVASAGLQDFRVSGIFSSTDPASMVRFLREQPGIRVVESGKEIRVSSD